MLGRKGLFTPVLAPPQAGLATTASRVAIVQRLCEALMDLPYGPGTIASQGTRLPVALDSDVRIGLDVDESVEDPQIRVHELILYEVGDLVSFSH